MRIVIEKAKRRLTLWDEDRIVMSCRAGLGQSPAGPKEREGDGRTPEGEYAICLVKEHGKYGRSLGLSYPSEADAKRARALKRIDDETLCAILRAHAEERRPPWGTPLGGEIYIHEGGSGSDWTQGCVALDEADMDLLFPCWERVKRVEIRP